MTSLGNMEVTKTGWLEKYSVGRGIIPLKNWQRRWFTVDHNGLNYSKSPSELPAQRTYIPFVSGPASKNTDVRLAPVFLYPCVTSSIHPEASVANMWFFALRFRERNTPRLLLLRTGDLHERDAWVKFLAHFVHAAPLTETVLWASEVKTEIDPDALAPHERIVLRQSIMNWDEGCHFRLNGIAPPPDNFDDCTVWHSEDETSTRASRIESNEQHSSAASPRAISPTTKTTDYDML